MDYIPKKSYFCSEKVKVIMIKRHLEKTIKANLYKGKAIIILGARQVGKTTLLITLKGKEEYNLSTINKHNIQ